MHETLKLTRLTLFVVADKAIYYYFHVFIAFDQRLSKNFVKLVVIFISFYVIPADSVYCICRIGKQQANCVKDQIEIVKHGSKI